MTGYQSKRLISNSRYADPVTIDYIIELRKQVAKLEMQLENALAWVGPVKKENKLLRNEIKRIIGSMNLAEKLNDTERTNL